MNERDKREVVQQLLRLSPFERAVVMAKVERMKGQPAVRTDAAPGVVPIRTAWGRMPQRKG